MAIEIRPIERERAEDYTRAVWRGFHDPAIDDDDLALRRDRWVDGRWWVALDGDEIVSTLRTLPLGTTLPGGAELTSCGVTAVTTASTHRRRGLMAETMRRALRAGRDAGEPLTTLIAAEWPIYGRFGFGAAVEGAVYRLDASAARVTEQGRGDVTLVTTETLLAEAPAVYDRHRAASPGEITRDDFTWRMQLVGTAKEPWKGFQALCRDAAGAVSGYVRYRIEREWDQRVPANVVKVDELLGTDAAQARLWRYVAEIDWVRTVTAENRSVDELLPWWLADGRHLRQTERADLVWARPLDVVACLSARTYAAPLDAVIEVVDPLGLSSGRFRLRTDGGPGTASPTTDAADLTLPVATLGVVLFGGYALATLARAGRADEHRAGAVAAASAAFHGDVTPWSATWF